jgi:hypothetical protein
MFILRWEREGQDLVAGGIKSIRRDIMEAKIGEVHTEATPLAGEGGGIGAMEAKPGHGAACHLEGAKGTDQACSMAI